MADNDFQNIYQMYRLMNSFQKNNSALPSQQNQTSQLSQQQKKIKDTPIVLHSGNVINPGFVAKAFTRGTAEDESNSGNTWVNLVDGSLSSILSSKRATAIDSAAADAQERVSDAQQRVPDANAGLNIDYCG